MMPTDNQKFTDRIKSARATRQTATEIVIKTLRDAILSGDLQGGEPLRQDALSSAFETSRMPIREALRVLEAQGLIDFKPHHGAIVSMLSANDLSDLYSIRSALEVEALRKSVPLSDSADFDRAEEYMNQLGDETDPKKIVDLNLQFHLTLYGQTDAPKLLTLVEHHISVSRRYSQLHMSTTDRHISSQQEHAEILLACRQKDIETATQILVQHINTSCASIRKIIEGISSN